MQKNKPFVSVIIPVYNDLERLRICLQALEEQSYPVDSYEVVVVDNNSDDNIGPESLKEFEHVRLEFEGERGSYTARNKGVSVAKGDILAFTDSDCIPDTKWIENGINAFVNHSNCGLVVGKVELFYKNPKKPTPVEIWQKLFSFRQEHYVESSKFGATANVFTSREVIENTGYFNEVMYSCADHEFGKRIFDHGYDVIYSDIVIVKHPARSSFKHLFRRQMRLAGGVYELDTLVYKRENLGLIKTARDAIPPVVTLFRIMKKKDIGELQSVIDKIGFIFLYFFIRYATLFEKIRLKLGGKPKKY